MKYRQAFLNDDGWGDTNVDWKWCYLDTGGNPHAATNILCPGIGFFYKARGVGFTWQESKPYPWPEQ